MRTNESNSWVWARIQKRYLRTHPRCEMGAWGCLGRATVVDHIIDRVDGGGDADDNLRALCHPCHERHTQETKARRAKMRKQLAEEARRKNHPGRKDRWE